MKQKMNLTRILPITFLLILIVGAGFISAQAQSVTVQYTTTQDYGSGFAGEIKIINGGTQAINGWTLEFDFNRNFNSVWDAQILSHTGNHYAIKNVSYNSTIPAGGSVTFGFSGTPGNVNNSPTGYILNGAMLGRTATTFSYQGRLNDGSANANGAYDLQFNLYDEGGTQFGATQTIDNVNVTNGIFNVLLDFGAAAFSGANRVLEIKIRRGAENGAYTTLTPRQPVTPAPYAIRSLSAATADSAATSVSATNFSGLLSGDIGGTQTATVIQPNSVTAPKIASNQVVKSVNGLKDSVTLAGGSGITVTPNGNTLTFSLRDSSLKRSVWTVTPTEPTQFDIPHNLGTQDVIVQVYRQQSQGWIQIGLSSGSGAEGFAIVMNANTTRVGMYSAGTYRIVIIG